MIDQLEMQIKRLGNRLKDEYYDGGQTKRKIEDAIELLSKILDALTL